MDIPEPLRVTRRSPFMLRKEVERFAIYFMREFGIAVFLPDPLQIDAVIPLDVPRLFSVGRFGVCCRALQLYPRAFLRQGCPESQRLPQVLESRGAPLAQRELRSSCSHVDLQYFF
jgi:hypothetical protein